MKWNSWLISVLFIFSFDSYGHSHQSASVIPHQKVKTFTNNGNSLKGLATPSKGSNQFEVWQSEMAPGKSTPKHTHETDEVFVFLKGKVEITVGDKVQIVEAPATIIAPANVPHQVKNIGTVKTHQIVIVGAGSKIWNKEGKILNLPWRK